MAANIYTSSSFNLMTMPTQLIPDKDKNSEWMRENLLQIKNRATKNISAKRKDIECWFMYHNIYNEKEFEYLTKYSSGTENQSDYYLPAKVRHIPIQRAKINILVSQQKHRPFVFSSKICDLDGRTQKQLRQIHEFVGHVQTELENKVYAYTQQLQAIEQKKQELQQILQVQPTTNEQAQEQMMVRQTLPMIEQKMFQVQSAINKQLVFTNEDIVKMNRLFKMNNRDWVEEMVQKLTQKLRKELGIETKSVKNYISHVVTGKQAYYVDYDTYMEREIFEPLNMINVYYPCVEGVEWIQDGPWVMIERRLTLSQCKDKYNLTEDEMKELEQDYPISNYANDFFSTAFGEYVNNMNLLYSGTPTNNEGIPEYQIIWRSQKKIMAKKVPNPYEEKKPFIHFIDNDDKVLNTGQLYYDKKKNKYIDKKTGREWEKKDVINKVKGEELEERYMDELYEGTMLGNKIYKNYRKRAVRLYSNENYSWTILPVIGKCYNSIIERPYSLIWDTRDLQKLYNLFNYHKELLLATSGVKGSIMDDTQRPEGMSRTEWMYYKKLGTMWIQTVKKSGKISSFNQFGAYDDSVSPAIQYIDGMMRMIDETMGQIIGVGRERMGQITSDDQVATYQMAIQQNSLITEIIYAEHDEIERRALEALLNLSLKYRWKDGGTFEWETEDMGVEQINIPPDLLNNMDFKVDMLNNTLEEKKLTELKQFAMQEYTKGTMPFKEMLALYNTETVKELEIKAKEFIAKDIELFQRSKQEDAESNKEFQKEIMQFQSELDMNMKAQELKMKEMELQLKSNIENLKLQNEQAKIQLLAKQGEDDKQLRIMDMESERNVETAYLQETSRANQMGERLQAIELQINTMMDHFKEGNKVHIEKMKSKAGNKEHIKD